MQDDNWVLFAIDRVKGPDKQHPDFHLMWAGTTNAVVNELMCQRFKRDAYPFDLTAFNIQSMGANGLLFSLTTELYENEEFRRVLAESLATTAHIVAEQQGYILQIAEPGTYEEGFMFMAAHLNVDVNRHPERYWGSGDKEIEAEEEE